MENKEYIERETLKRLMTFGEDDIILTGGKTFVNFENVRDAIEYTHAAEVEPIKHAKWVADDTFDNGASSVFHCSECYYTNIVSTPCTVEELSVEDCFCKKCGAKMDGGK